MIGDCFLFSSPFPKRWYDQEPCSRESRWGCLIRSHNIFCRTKHFYSVHRSAMSLTRTATELLVWFSAAIRPRKCSSARLSSTWRKRNCQSTSGTSPLQAAPYCCLAPQVRRSRRYNPLLGELLLSVPVSLMVILLIAICAEPYLQSLAKALSHYFKARLLILDADDFSLRVRWNCYYSNFDL